MPTTPILPGPPGVVPAAPTVAPALGPAPAPAEPGTDATGLGSFVDQLAAALALLSQPTTPEATDPDTEVELAPAQDDDADGETATEDLSVILASFGLVPVPIPPSVAVTQPQPVCQAGEPPAVEPIHLPVGEPAPAVDQTHRLVEPRSRGQVESGQVEPPRPEEPQPAQVEPPRPEEPRRAQVGPPRLDEPQPAQLEPPRLDEPQPAQLTYPPASAAATDDRPTRTPSRPPVDTPQGPATTLAPLGADPPAGTAEAGSDPGSGPGSDAERGEPRHHHQSTHEVIRASDPPRDQVAPPASIAAPALGNTPEPAQAVHPREVVAQIAHQAELYRLPGGRGVRIQLRPEGLGGVEVTVRYGAAGALELHLNVEHAATGALLQAGWTQLRDALSVQGISPDRLVMSVSGPNGGSSSENGSFGWSGGFRSEAGPAWAGSDQSGSHGQQERQQAPARTRANPSIQPPAAPEPAPATPISSSTRIDLRA